MAKVIHLISCPRTLSTALMYAFSQRDDTEVIDEPWYGVFLATTGAQRPDREATLALWPNDFDEASAWIAGKMLRPVLFLKNMAAHFGNIDLSVLDDHACVIYTRHPERILASYTRTITDPTFADLGLRKQWEIAEYLLANNKPFLVIDSTDLLSDPARYLKAICDFARIPFQQEMLSWPQGPREFDGPWATYWYDTLHRSTGFRQRPSRSKSVEDKYLPLLDELLPFYELLIQHKTDVTEI